MCFRFQVPLGVEQQVDKPPDCVMSVLLTALVLLSVINLPASLKQSAGYSLELS